MSFYNLKKGDVKMRNLILGSAIMIVGANVGLHFPSFFREGAAVKKAQIEQAEFVRDGVRKALKFSTDEITYDNEQEALKALEKKLNREDYSRVENLLKEIKAAGAIENIVRGDYSLSSENTESEGALHYLHIGEQKHLISQDAHEFLMYASNRGAKEYSLSTRTGKEVINHFLGWLITFASSWGGGLLANSGNRRRDDY